MGFEGVLHSFPVLQIKVLHNLGFLLYRLCPLWTEKMVLMLQKEVAQRVVAQTKFGPKKDKMNLLAISVQVFSDPKIAFRVSAGNFSPRPRVDSAVVVFSKKPEDFFKKHGLSQKTFFKLVKAGFAHKRKLLKSNLKLSKTEFLTNCRVAENARAENLSLENWACLVRCQTSNV